MAAYHVKKNPIISRSKFLLNSENNGFRVKIKKYSSPSFHEDKFFDFSRNDSFSDDSGFRKTSRFFNGKKNFRSAEYSFFDFSRNNSFFLRFRYLEKVLFFNRKTGRCEIFDLLIISFIQNFLKKMEKFNPAQIKTINESVSMAEDLVSDFYNTSANQWLRKYDVKTLTDLSEDEIVHGPFAQVIRYEGRRKDAHLGSSAYDFYKICIQDHAILSVLEECSVIKLFPFSLYIVTHELIHVVRFCNFHQRFDASPGEKMAEETRVHQNTYKILEAVRVQGMEHVFQFYNNWRMAES